MENLVGQVQRGELKVIGAIDGRRTVGRAWKLAVGVRVTRSDENLVRGLVIHVAAADVSISLPPVVT